MKVLICVNDLLIDEPGLIFGANLAENLGAEITLLHVISKNKQPGDRENGEQLLNNASQMLGNLYVDKKVRRGNVVKRIIKETKRGNFDIVIISVS